MNSYSFDRFSVCLLLFLLHVFPAHSVGSEVSEEGSPRAPNIVFILADDLGYMDVEPYNPETFYETPQVTRLAESGVVFTDAYAASPVCSPTRYSIMTGKHPSGGGVTNWFTGQRKETFLPAPFNDRMPEEEVTLAEALRAEGYRTAFLGKWHLGHDESFWPEAQGFEVNIGGYTAGHPRSYFSPYRNPRVEDGPDGEYLTERLGSESLALIERWKDEPFFLFLSFYTVHTPLQAPAALVEKYEQKAEALGRIRPTFMEEPQVHQIEEPRKVRTSQDHAIYAAMVESMDTQVGRVLDQLERLGIADDTIVFFTSDNGGLSSSEGLPTSNRPLRAGKGWVYEGGIRVPLIVSWPGVTMAAANTSVPVVSHDLYPTVLEIAGLTVSPEQGVDGESLVPLLRQSGRPARGALFWHFPHYSNQGGFPGGAIRMGDFKLVENYEDGAVSLFDLRTDLSEEADLAVASPDRVQEMRSRLHEWYEEVNAKFLYRRDEGPEPWRPRKAAK